MTPDGAILLGALTDLGVEIVQHSDAVVAYTKERTAFLAGIAGEAGYREALKAEAVNVALFALGVEIAEADALDAAVVRTFHTILAVGVRVALV